MILLYTKANTQHTTKAAQRFWKTNKGKTFIPGLKGLGIQVALDWKPLGDKGAVPELAFINKQGAQVAVDAFTALAYFGLGKLPVTSTPLTTTQKNVLGDVYTTLEAAINNIYQQGLQQIQSNQ